MKAFKIYFLAYLDKEAGENSFLLKVQSRKWHRKFLNDGWFTKLRTLSGAAPTSHKMTVICFQTWQNWKCSCVRKVVKMLVLYQEQNIIGTMIKGREMAKVW